MDYTYEYYIVLDDGSFVSRDGESRGRDEWEDILDRTNYDLRGFFPTRSLAHLAGEGFTAVVKRESNIDITYKVLSIVRKK